MDAFGFMDGHADTVTAAMESGQCLYKTICTSTLSAF